MLPPEPPGSRGAHPGGEAAGSGTERSGDSTDGRGGRAAGRRAGHADDPPVPRRQGPRRGRVPLLPAGRLLRAVLRGRGPGRGAARHHPDRTEQGPRAGADVRRPVPRGAPISGEAARGRPQGGHLRAAGGARPGPGHRPAGDRPHRHPGHRPGRGRARRLPGRLAGRGERRGGRARGGAPRRVHRGLPGAAGHLAAGRARGGRGARAARGAAPGGCAGHGPHGPPRDAGGLPRHRARARPLRHHPGRGLPPQPLRRGHARGLRRGGRTAGRRPRPAPRSAT